VSPRILKRDWQGKVKAKTKSVIEHDAGEVQMAKARNSDRVFKKSLHSRGVLRRLES
jgi:hypothetical protein